MFVRPGVFVVPDQVVAVVENPQPGTPGMEGKERTITILVGRNGTPVGVTLKSEVENESEDVAKMLGVYNPPNARSREDF